VSPVSDKIYVPVVERKNAQVLSVAGDVAQLMDMGDFSTFEMTVPEEYKDRVVEGEEVSYLTAMGKMKFDLR
jgi:translation initiation factor 5A